MEYFLCVWYWIQTSIFKLEIVTCSGSYINVLLKALSYRQFNLILTSTALSTKHTSVPGDRCRGAGWCFLGCWAHTICDPWMGEAGLRSEDVFDEGMLGVMAPILQMKKQAQRVQSPISSVMELRQDVPSNLPNAVVSSVLGYLWYKTHFIFLAHVWWRTYPLLSQNCLSNNLHITSKGHETQYQPPKGSQSFGSKPKPKIWLLQNKTLY